VSLEPPTVLGRDVRRPRLSTARPLRDREGAVWLTPDPPIIVRGRVPREPTRGPSRASPRKSPRRAPKPVQTR
jgi:hypothetical protein